MRHSQRAWSVERRDGTIDEKGNAIAQLIGGHHVVSREEDRRARLPDVANDLTNEARGHWVEPCRRFVQEDQLRTVKECAREREPPAHALRKLAYELVAVLV